MFTRKKTAVALAPSVPDERVRAVTKAKIPAQYSSAGGVEERAPRASVYKNAVLRLSGGREISVVIRNLSVTGCRVEFVDHAKLTGRVLITEPSVPLELWASIIWAGKGACGLSFDGNEPE
jgi:hypothetical protein